MQHVKPSDAEHHEYYDGTVTVAEFNFQGNAAINTANIVLTGRYPAENYTVNNSSTALISVEAGEGTITIKDKQPKSLNPGDNLLIEPGEPYFFSVMGSLAIRYIATPAWTVEQSEIVE